MVYLWKTTTKSKMMEHIQTADSKKKTQHNFLLWNNAN